LDVGQDTTLSNGDTSQEIVQLLIVLNGQLQVTWNNSGPFVVWQHFLPTQSFSSQVFHHSDRVNRGAGTNLLGIVALTKKSVDSFNWALQSSP